MHRIVSLMAAVLAVSAAGQLWAADAAAGKTKAMPCAACHGAIGVSALPNYPNLAGQKEAYLLKQLQDFKGGKRTDPSMAGMVAALSDADMADLAAYFASLPAGK